MKKTAITALVLDTRYKKQNEDTFPVKIRVTHNRVQKYYPTGYDLTEKEWTKIQERKRNEKIPTELKAVQISLNEIEATATNIIDHLPAFSFDLFKKRFSNNFSNATVAGAFAKYIADLKEQERFGTAHSYEYACKSLERFKKGVTFPEINKQFLQKYEKWMKNNGNGDSSIGMYLRALRVIFNSAISDGDIPVEIYPFGNGKDKYEIPTTENRKKALTINEISDIINFSATGTAEAMRDYWYFMYLCNGINPKDFCLLKNKNKSEDLRFIEFNRAKTANTRRKKKSIKVALHEPAIKIIEKYGDKSGDPEAYIFPVLNIDMTAEEIHKAKDNFTGLVNDHVKKIAKAVGIAKPVTTSYARHSFATALKRSGKNLSLVSELLGHSDIKVTEHYLDSFDEETLHEMTEAIIPKEPAKVRAR